MSKRVPVYMNEQELRIVHLALYELDKKGLRESVGDKLDERISEELGQFEEDQPLPNPSRSKK